MQSYLVGQSLSLVIPLVDSDSGCIAASSVDYRIVDESDTELVSRVALSGFVSGDTQAVISISGTINALVGIRRGLRSVELYLTTPAGELRINQEYIVEIENMLELGINSFQSYNAALLTGFEIPNLPGWLNATKPERIKALVSAWRNIGLLYLKFIPNLQDGFDMKKIVYLTTDSGNLCILTPEQFGTLPDLMKSAVIRAQVIEADYMLDTATDDDILSKRRSGLLSRKVGESTDVYSPVSTSSAGGLSYEPTICKRAMKELSRYIVHGKRLTRSS